MKVSYADATGQTTYGLIFRKSDGFVWRHATSVFEAYNAANYADYDVAGTENGASGVYSFDFPAGITGGGGYDIYVKRRVGGSPAQSDLLIWERELWWTGSAPTAPPPAAGTPEQVTGYLYVYDEDGVVESGVTIYCRLVGFNQDQSSVDLQYGYALDSAQRSAVSDGAGLVSFSGLFKGMTYNVKRGSSSGYSVEIPADADDPFALPSVIGED